PHSLRFLRSGRQTLAAVAPESAHSWGARVSRHGAVCPDSVRCAPNAGSIFVAAIEGTTQGAAEGESSQSDRADIVALAEIRRRQTSCQEVGRCDSDSHAPRETAQESAAERSSS